jgi:hypothetical protein
VLQEKLQRSANQETANEIDGQRAQRQRRQQMIQGD